MIQIVCEVPTIDEQSEGNIWFGTEGVLHYTTNNSFSFVLAELDQYYRGIAVLVND